MFSQNQTCLLNNVGCTARYEVQPKFDKKLISELVEQVKTSQPFRIQRQESRESISLEAVLVWPTEQYISVRLVNTSVLFQDYHYLYIYIYIYVIKIKVYHKILPQFRTNYSQFQSLASTKRKKDIIKNRMLNCSLHTKKTNNTNKLQFCPYKIQKLQKKKKKKKAFFCVD